MSAYVVLDATWHEKLSPEGPGSRWEMWVIYVSHGHEQWARMVGSQTEKQQPKRRDER